MRTRESGFTMVAFVMTIAVMSIFMGVAVQSVSFQMQREREAELIFRGEQYVEAIRLYRKKYGRSPVKLKELWEAKPRVIRKEWEDPFTDSTSWGLIFEGQQRGARGGQRLGAPGGLPGQPGGAVTGGGVMPTGTPGSGFGSRRGAEPAEGQETARNFVVSGEDGEGAPAEGGQPARVGPIIGVHSTDCRDSVRVYEGRTVICEWQFMFRERQQPGGPGQPGAGPGVQPPGRGDQGTRGGNRWNPRLRDRMGGRGGIRPPPRGITPTPNP